MKPITNTEELAEKIISEAFKDKKDKAENLIEKFIPNTRIWNDEKKVWEDCIESAKRGALITVDEIINSLENYGKESDELQNMENDFRYWQEVKQELLNMK